MAMPIPANEAERLAALGLYRVLDTPPEFAYDALTELAAQICGCPVALVSLVDERRQWFKAKYGLPANFTECPREVSVCASTICANDQIYAPNLTTDPRFKDLPIVTGEPNLRFYCGMPLINREGYAVGTLCVVDFKPHELTPSQREAVRRLAQQAMAQLELRRQLLEREDLVRDLTEAKAAAERQGERSDALLRSILPATIAEELKASGHVQPRYHESATVLLADFKDFTRLTEGLDPAGLVNQLNQNFVRFDEIAAAHRLETLKTIGDAYLCAGGLPEANRSHAIDACLAALAMQRFMSDNNRQRERLRLRPWLLRIGINTGPLVAGVVGTRHLAYDVWGNSVNVAQRLEEACEPGRVNLAASTLHRVAALFETEPRGSIEVKHMGAIDMYFVARIKPEFSSDAEGLTPNEAFWKAAGVAAPAT
jgi:class 3 adenylate cyclase